MAGSSATLEFSNIWMILGVWGRDDCLLSAVSLISNSFLADWNFVFEALAQNSNVGFCSRVGSIHPDKTILEDRESKLVVNTCLVKLVGVVQRVLSESRVLGFIDATMHTINCDDYGGVVVVINRLISRSPALGPHNLIA